MGVSNWVARLTAATVTHSAASATAAGTYSRAVIVAASAGGSAADRDDALLPEALLVRVPVLLRAAGVTDVTVVAVSGPTAAPPDLSREPASTLVLAVGPHALTRSLIRPQDVTGLSPESFVVRTSKLHGGATLIAVDGVNWKDAPKPASRRAARVWKHGNRGLAYGVYAVLEDLGFAFLHPLAPSIPPSLPVLTTTSSLDRSESPRWTQARAIHYHTQHPLELTPFLQGFGPKGHTDVSGWEDGLHEWASYCEWLVANRQNGVEWPLLETGSWAAFARSSERIDRLRTIVEVGHAFGVAVGLDVPIAFAQQHSFRLLRNGTGKDSHLEAEKAEIKESLDWVMRAGFDFLGTENGTSEFTHTSPETMLQWMSAASDYAAEKYSVPMDIKVHCSSGQVAKGYTDDRTGKPINYNMLPHFASPTMGVLPHTVETYALDDPAPTYGNENFKYIREYLAWERELGVRSTVFYPETAYWVSVDIDVPLFLPIYADRRVHDLNLLAGDEDASPTKRRMDGQLIFSSGWEWGYWLNDVIAARAAWDPKQAQAASSHRSAVKASLAPLTRHLGPLRAEAEDLIADWCEAQKDLLIYGKIGNAPAPESVNRRNGHAYLEGWDTWDDVSKLLGKLTQPDRLGLIEFKHGSKWLALANKHLLGKMDTKVEYATIVAPLLEAMDTTFTKLAARTEDLAAKVPAHFKDLWDDIADAARMTALRARHVRVLYEYIDVHHKKGDPSTALAKEAVNIIQEGLKVVARREPR
ncbi:hypothetical protein HK405_000813, partial [Cladochytrium tenue]